MAKLYYQGKSGFDLIKKNKPNFKPFIENLEKWSSKYNYSKSTFIETDDGKLSGTPLIKYIVDISTFTNVLSFYKSQKNLKEKSKKPDSESVFSISNLGEIRAYRSGGRLANFIDETGNSQVRETPKTEQQENGTLFCLQSLSSGKKFPTKDLINKNAGFNFDKSWHDSFEKTTILISNFFSNRLPDYNFYRDGDKRKPDYLNNMTDNKILPDKKDNWNPADIWAVKKTNEQTIRKEINDLHSKIVKQSADIFTLNNLLENYVKTKKLFGISLKKIDTGKGKIIKVEKDAKFIKNISYEGVFKVFTYKCSNSYFEMFSNFKSFGKMLPYKFVFRPRGKSGDLNIYAEGREINSGHFDGAISSEIIGKLYPKLDVMATYLKQQKKMPKTAYDAVKSQDIDKGFKSFVNKKNYSHFIIEELDKPLGTFECARAAILLYHLYLFESSSGSQKKDNFKQMYLSGKKQNDFSSIHFKVTD